MAVHARQQVHIEMPQVGDAVALIIYIYIYIYIYGPCGAGHRVSRPRGTGSVGVSVGEGRTGGMRGGDTGRGKARGGGFLRP